MLHIYCIISMIYSTKVSNTCIYLKLFPTLQHAAFSLNRGVFTLIILCNINCINLVR